LFPVFFKKKIKKFAPQESFFTQNDAPLLRPQVEELRSSPASGPNTLSIAPQAFIA
jgi:hypothetical protein